MKQHGTLNILMLGGAKRVSMGRMLIRAGERLGFETNLFSYELSKLSPIASVATVVEGLRWTDPALMFHLHKTVTDNAIDVIIPFVDPAVAIAARYRDEFADVWAPVADAASAERMFDKTTADDLFAAAGIPVPARRSLDNPVFPIIAKPRHGSASKGITVITDATDAAAFDGSPDGYILQEYIAHRQEYTVDCYVTLAGEIKTISPRRRLEVTGGEVTSTVTVDYPEAVALTRRVIEAAGLRGAVTVQFLLDTATSRLLLMEVNPRLGGGAVASVHAGANIPLLMLAEATSVPVVGENVPEPGTLITRYPQEVVFHDQR